VNGKIKKINVKITGNENNVFVNEYPVNLCAWKRIGNKRVLKVRSQVQLLFYFCFLHLLSDKFLYYIFFLWGGGESISQKPGENKSFFVYLFNQSEYLHLKLVHQLQQECSHSLKASGQTSMISKLGVEKSGK